jgi:hypothetical protein
LPLQASDLRSARAIMVSITALLALGFGVWVLRGGPAPGRVSRMLWDECRARYTAARTHGDTVLVDAHIPSPAAQGRHLTKCWDFRTDPRFH